MSVLLNLKSKSGDGEEGIEVDAVDPCRQSPSPFTNLRSMTDQSGSCRYSFFFVPPAPSLQWPGSPSAVVDPGWS